MPPTLTAGDKAWPLERGTITIGRQDTCDIVLNDRSLSRAHATIEVSRQAVQLSDNNSSNGTFVNSIRIGATELKHGDKVRFGSVECVFSWPESVVEVSVSPISAEQAQELKHKLKEKADVQVDWKTSLTTAAAFGAVGTGIVAGIFGAMLGTEALLGAVLVGAVGGIGTSLFVRNQMQQRVTGTLDNLKDDLDLFFAGTRPEITKPKGFPEMGPVIDSIHLGVNIIKDREGYAWRQQLHSAQVELEAQRALSTGGGSDDRGFTDPLMALDSGFRLQGWNATAKALFKAGASEILGVHILELLANAELGNWLIGTLNALPAGGVQVFPKVMQAADGRPLTLVITQPANGPASHHYILQFTGPQA